MVDAVYFDEYANILVFYLYLSKDAAVIQKLLANARRIFADCLPSDLESGVKSINMLYVSVPKPVALLDGDVNRNREAYRSRLDEIEEHSPPAVQGEKLAYDDGLDTIVKFNIALKTIHILGQVVRNVPGSLKHEIKTEDTLACYLLGLRLLTVVLTSIDENQEYLPSYFARMIGDQRAGARNSELPRSSEEAILNFAQIWAFGMVKKISQCVGLPELDASYREILKTHGNMLSVQLVDLSIRLDHYWAFPAGQVEELYSRTRKNLFSQCVLRDLVVHYFYPFKCQGETLSKYARLFGIDTPSARSIEAGLQKADLSQDTSE